MEDEGASVVKEEATDDDTLVVCVIAHAKNSKQRLDARVKVLVALVNWLLITTICNERD